MECRGRPGRVHEKDGNAISHRDRRRHAAIAREVAVGFGAAEPPPPTALVLEDGRAVHLHGGREPSAVPTNDFAEQRPARHDVANQALLTPRTFSEPASGVSVRDRATGQVVG